MWLHAYSVMSDSLQPDGLYPAKLLCPWDFPGKNTGVGSYFLLQGIFPTQRLKSQDGANIFYEDKNTPLSMAPSSQIT